MMELNEYQFAYRVSTEVCACLMAEDALHACFKVISEYMPVDRMYLESWDSDLGAVRAIATATKEGGKAIDQIVPISSNELAQTISTVRGQAPQDNVFIVNHPSKDPISFQMLQGLGRPTDVSIVGTYAVLEGEVVGSIIATVSGEGLYTKEHAKLFALLKGPFAIAIQNALRYREVVDLKNSLNEFNKFLQRELRSEFSEQIVGADFGLSNTMRSARQVAIHDSPVLLLGETGTGKDVIANHIHQTSNRHDGPFIKVNCGAIPDALIDSELFGHEKGAFTGALSQKRGRFERANKGTIFLDEIGELPPQAQTRLLRVIQNQEIERVGGTKTIDIDIRIIAATHRNLELMVEQGQFREDLWYRLNVFPLHIPPLRARRNDIPALVQFFLKKKSTSLKFGVPPKLSREVMNRLIDYPWKGNVRELENVIERALILGAGKEFVLDHLVDNVHDTPRYSSKGKIASLDQAITEHIQRALAYTDGKVHGAGGAADLLKINPSTLRSKIKKLGLEV